MHFASRRLSAVFTALIALTLTIGISNSLAQDVAHWVTGVVKSVDKDTKTVVITAADGTEHTIKYTDQTVVKAPRMPPKAPRRPASTLTSLPRPAPR